MTSQYRAIVTDPVHRALDFGPSRETKALLKSIIDHRCFQRLRRITQLGMASYVYPGATHTRFAHCLGAAYLSRLVVSHLREAEGADELMNDEHTILCATLLHDIGHGPFSHLFEKVFECDSDLFAAGDAPTHEDWTFAVASQLVQGLHGVDGERLLQMFRAPKRDRSRHRLPLYMRHIMSSQLDVDRMDYLLRDAYYSGVALGNIDLQYLIKSLAIIEKGGERLLGLTTKGVVPYEAFALARHFMNRSVYKHPKVRVLEYMMEHCLSEIVLHLRRHPKLGKHPLVPRFIQMLSTRPKAAKSEFIEASFDHYIALTEDGVWTLLRHVVDEWDTSVARDLAERLFSRRLYSYFRIREGHDAPLLERFQKFGVQCAANENAGYDDDVIVLSTSSTVYKQSSTPVFVRHSESVEPITKSSYAISAYRDRSESEKVVVILRESDEPRLRKAIHESGCVSVRPKATRNRR